MPRIDQLTVDQFALLLLTAALVLLAVVAFAHFSQKSASTRRYRSRNRYPAPTAVPNHSSDLTDYGQQLRAVQAATFEKRPIMNRSEYRVFKVVENEVLGARKGYRVFAQTSLGEVLRSQEEDARRSINSKRVDILIIDQGGRPIVAVEYQGSGHYQGNAAARDAVKKEALRRAGVHLLEVSANDSDEQIRVRLLEYLGWETSKILKRGSSSQVSVLTTPSLDLT